MWHDIREQPTRSLSAPFTDLIVASYSWSIKQRLMTFRARKFRQHKRNQLRSKLKSDARHTKQQQREKQELEVLWNSKLLRRDSAPFTHSFIPSRILDMGSGSCYVAFAYSKYFIQSINFKLNFKYRIFHSIHLTSSCCSCSTALDHNRINSRLEN